MCQRPIWRLAPVLPITYSSSAPTPDASGRPGEFGLEKSSPHDGKHSESLRHACAHCGSFAPAAPRRTRILVSESVSGLPLSRPVQIIALPGLYPNNKLICRSPILRSVRYHSRTSHLSGVSPTFAGLCRTIGQVDYVLLSCSPWRTRTSMA